MFNRGGVVTIYKLFFNKPCSHLVEHKAGSDSVREINFKLSCIAKILKAKDMLLFYFRLFPAMLINIFIINTGS